MPATSVQRTNIARRRPLGRRKSVRARPACPTDFVYLALLFAVPDGCVCLCVHACSLGPLSPLSTATPGRWAAGSEVMMGHPLFGFDKLTAGSSATMGSPPSSPPSDSDAPAGDGGGDFHSADGGGGDEEVQGA